MTIHIDQLNFQTDNSLALEAAELIMQELAAASGEEFTDDEAALYVAAMRSSSTYGLIHHKLGLLAASNVEYGIRSTQGNQTEIRGIAVRSEYQRRGYGRQLMNHIAHEAIMRGDSIISLRPIDTTPYLQLGFKEHRDTMYARPEDVLASSIREILAEEHT